MLDFAEFCEENGYSEEDETAWEEFMDMVEYELKYHAHEFNEDDEDDQTILSDCNGEFFKI